MTTLTLWKRETLEQLVADLQAENKELKEQIKQLLAAYRNEVVRNAKEPK